MNIYEQSVIELGELSVHLFRDILEYNFVVFSNSLTELLEVMFECFIEVFIFVDAQYDIKSSHNLKLYKFGLLYF